MEKVERHGEAGRAERKRPWRPIELKDEGKLGEILKAGMKTRAGGDSDSLKNAGAGG